MPDKYRSLCAPLCVLLVLSLPWLVGCAKQASPEGGPYDVIAPRVVRTTPAFGDTMVTKGRVRIYFDEYIKLERGQDNIIYSPPQRIPPKTVVNQKHLDIIYQDSLQPNTTYTIAFSNAIADFNEGNLLEHYFFAFSTGPTIDSMQIAGRVLDAYTLLPVPKVLAGVYDSAVQLDSVDQPMMRMTMTDSEGRFVLSNLRNGSYRAIALEDKDRSYSYNTPNESFAVSTEAFQTRFLLDTVAHMSLDSLAGDSIVSASRDSIIGDSMRMRYMPDDLLLLLTRPTPAPGRLDKCTRRDSVSLVATFTQPIDILPQLQIITPRREGSQETFFVDLAADRKSIVYWLTPYEGIATDTLQVALSYPALDSIAAPIMQTDTFTMRPIVAMRAMNRAQRHVVDSLATNPSALGIHFGSKEDIDKETTRDSLWLLAPEPIVTIDTTRLALYEVIDSTLVPRPYTLEGEPYRCTRYLIDFAKRPGAKYQIVADSNAVVGLYHAVGSLADKYSIAIAAEEERGRLEVSLGGYPEGMPIYIELLNSSEELLATRPLDSVGQAIFTELPPGEYFLKLYLDTNGNGHWDGGHYPDRQPEEVQYYPQSVSVQARFTTQEHWEYGAVPLERQRPSALKAETNTGTAQSNTNNPQDKSRLNTEYIQRMRDRYGDRWNPSDRERRILGMPSRAEEREDKLQQQKQVGSRAR